MAGKPAFEHDLVVREQYLSIAFHHWPGAASNTLLNQARVLTPDSTADTKKYKRIGDVNELSKPGTKAHNVTVDIYVEDTLAEVAVLMGTALPPGGWVGNEAIELNTDLKHDLIVENYATRDVGSALLWTEYLYGFKPSSVTMNLDAEGDVRIAQFKGVSDRYYITPEAGVGA
jgi:hypothetical protein